MNEANNEAVDRRGGELDCRSDKSETNLLTGAFSAISFRLMKFVRIRCEQRSDLINGNRSE